MESVIKHSALLVFSTVAELGNIVAASGKLGRTPSAISMALRQLEDSLGARLFEGNRKTKLTAFGEYALAQARVELQSYERAIDSIRAYARNQIGRLRIACVPSVTQHIMPGLLMDFLGPRPNIELDLQDADTLTIVSLVESGGIDFGIGGAPPKTANLDFEVLFEDLFVLVCSAQNPLARKRQKKVNRSDLVDQTFIRNDASDAIDVAWLREVSSNSKLKVRNVTSLVSVVRRNLGVAVLPELALTDHEAGICKIRIGHDPKRQVGFITSRRSSMTPLATVFRTQMKAFVGSRKFGRSSR